MTTSAAQVRSLYRSLLRELPLRSDRSALQHRLRASLSDRTTPLDQAEQLLYYVKAQRMYTTLIERYNPGMSMDEEEKIRLTARRVGMDLPEEVEVGKKG